MIVIFGHDQGLNLLTFGDLFSGFAGLSLGLEEAGISRN